jgi:hypothetical protein
LELLHSFGCWNKFTGKCLHHIYIPFQSIYEVVYVKYIRKIAAQKNTELPQKS